MEHSRHRVSLGGRRARPGWSFYLSTFGQLKLSIDAQDRVLLLHIMEGKGLMSSEPGTCDPYVKISLTPEDPGLSCQKTQTVPDCRDPAFHEHFFFPVREEDEPKRLLVAVWNRAGDSRQSGLIGCMSFGVRSLLTPGKEISGWYYLLGEDLGRTKHLKVARRRLRPLRDPLLRMPGGEDTENGEELKVGGDKPGLDSWAQALLRVRTCSWPVPWPQKPLNRAALGARKLSKRAFLRDYCCSSPPAPQARGEPGPGPGNGGIGSS